MRLRTFRGRDLAAAMTAVRHALGDDALILETRDRGGEIEILTAVAGHADSDGSRGMPAPLVIPPPSRSDGDRRIVALRSHGISDAFLPSLADGDLAHALTKTLRFGDLPLGPDARPLLFAGPHGAGKTLSLLKIATRLVLRGETPVIVAADGERAGATEQLAAMSRLLGTPLVAAAEPDALRAALAGRPVGGPVLIDAPGIAIDAPAERDGLLALADAAGAEILLVLPAGLDVAEATDIAGGFADAGAARLVATRLDAAQRLGGIVEPARHAGLVLTEAGISRDVADGLVPLTVTMLADRLGTPAGRGGETPPAGARRPTPALQNKDRFHEGSRRLASPVDGR